MDRLRSLGVRLSNVLPRPPLILPGHERILGVVHSGALTQANKPALRFTCVRCCSSLTASIPHGLAAYDTAISSSSFMQLLSLAVASDWPRKGLSPSITQPCPTHRSVLGYGQRSITGDLASTTSITLADDSNSFGIVRFHALRLRMPSRHRGHHSGGRPCPRRAFGLCFFPRCQWLRPFRS